MYADKITGSMQDAIDETNRRRKIQKEHNIKYNIEPESIKKEIIDMLEREYLKENSYINYVADNTMAYRSNNLKELEDLRLTLKDQMLEAADNLEFERAAAIRDQMIDIEKKVEVLKKNKKK